MTKKIIIAVLALVIMALGFMFLNKRPAGQTPAGSEAQLILFWGIGCSHCQNVDEYLKENKTEERVKIQKLEVSQSSENSNLALEKAKVCQLDPKNLGVPFLWDGQNQKCYVGDQPIIDFFQGK